MAPLDHVTGRLIAAGRVLAGLSQAELAGAANISVSTLKRMEGSGEAGVSGLHNNVLAVLKALDEAGVIVGAGGVRLKRQGAPETGGGVGRGE